MNNYTEKQLALAWFEKQGIKTYESNGDVYIIVDTYHIMISSSEISYRADLFKEQFNQVKP